MRNPLLAASESIDRSSRLRSSSNFAGAQNTRLTFDFTAGLFSADQEIRYDLATLRARARRLVRNNSHASGFVNELANNVIGPDGILLQSKVRTRLGDLVKATNDEIERGWREWGMPENCSADGHDDWVELQRLVIKTIATDGEVFIRRLKYFGNEFGYALQILDADLVDENLNRVAEPGRNAIRMGVELNSWNRPVAYHTWTRHLGDQGVRERVVIPAAEMIHLFVRYRPNQSRGVTWFAPVLLNLHYLDGYEFSELTAARVSAAKMGFIKNMQPEAIAAYTPPKKGEQRTMDVEPGVFEELDPGQEVEMFDPKHPSTAFKDFTKTILRAIARGLNMSYTSLTGDLEAVNYSSIRAGLLSERDQFRSLQRWLGIHCHRLVYREWLDMALLSSAITVDSRLASDYYAVEWKPRGWKWVDPVNDLTAAALAIALGLDSRQRLAAEQGRDFEEIVEEIAHELEFADAMGVDVSGEAPTPASGPGRANEPPAKPDAPAIVDDTQNEDTSATAGARSASRVNARARDNKIRALKLALTLLESRAA